MKLDINFKWSFVGDLVQVRECAYVLAYVGARACGHACYLHVRVCVLDFYSVHSKTCLLIAEGKATNLREIV